MTTWIRMTTRQPEIGRSYLIAATYGGIETFDVAFYNGRRKDGSHWWTMTDVEIPDVAIDFWTEIDPPHESNSHDR